MSTNPLRPAAVLQAMADALPTHQQGDTTSDLSSSHEALALFAHACMTCLDFRLLGFDEDKTEEATCHSLAPRLPQNWNASFNTYAFVYAHQQSALRFVLKIDRLGGKAEIRGLAVNDERIARAEFVIRDYVSNASLPLRIPLLDGARPSVGSASAESPTDEDPSDATASRSRQPVEDRADLPQKLRDVMVSDARVADLASLLKLNIIQKLLPSLQKEGYEEDITADDHAVREDAEQSARRPPRQPPHFPDPFPQPAQPHPFADPLNPAPTAPVPAGDFPPPRFEDPYDIHRPLRGGPAGAGVPVPTPFGNIGADDLNPPALGPYDPLHPGRGAFGPGGLPRPGGGRGMHPTFDDPLFRGPGGDGDHDPQAPLGARYDPVGPGGFPRMGGRGGGPFGGGGGGFGGFGGNDFI